MVTWADRSSNEAGFRVERNPAFPVGTVTVGPNATAYLDQSGNGTYAYRVRAFNDAGASVFTDWTSVTVTSSATFGTRGTRKPGTFVTTSGNSVANNGGGGGGSNGNTGGGSGGGGSGGAGGGSGGSGGGGGGGTGGGGSGSGGTGGGGSGGSDPGGGTTGGAVAYGGGSGSCGVPIGNGSGAEGWTILTPSPDSRVVYISTSMGNDANSGMTEASPKRTIAAGYQLLRDGYPVWLLL
jgi:hypothetical protein